MVSMMGQKRPRRWGLGLLATAAVCLGAWLGGLFVYAETLPERAADDTRRMDAIVVLTGGSGRLDEGLRLLDEGLGGRLFVSGVYEGLDVRRLLRLSQHDPQGLEERISIGTASNTEGNALETREWMRAEGLRSLHLVTASYHMPRSLLEFRHAMPEAEIVPHPVFPEHVKTRRWWAWPGTAALIAEEYSKFLLAWGRHLGEKIAGPRPPAAAP